MMLIASLVFLIIGCSNNLKQKKVNDDLVLRQRAFVEELYMPIVTPWANFSDVGICKRESDWLYLNFHEVRKKTSLDYNQSLNLQYQLNVLWHQKKPFMTADSGAQFAHKLLPADRLSLLEQALERVNGGVNFWSIPQGAYPIWLIDWDQINPNERLDFLAKVLAQPEVSIVIPVIVSRCASSFSIKSILELRPELLSFSFILGVETLTVFPVSEDLDQFPLSHPLGAYFDEKSTTYWILSSQQDSNLKRDQIKIQNKIYKVKYF